MIFLKSIRVLSLFFILFIGNANAFSLGVNVRLFDADKTHIKNYLDTIKSIGVDSIRVDMPWKDVELKKDQLSIPANWDYFIDYANQNGITVLCILDYGNRFYDGGDKPISKDAVTGFVRYVNFLTKHFDDKIKFYQIWNEWNGKVGGTTPGRVDDYKNLVKATYPVIKKNAPHSIVITGSFSSAAFNKAIGLEKRGDYLRDYLSPDMAEYTDAISVHPYTTYRKRPYNEYRYYLMQTNYAYNLVKSNPAFKTKMIFITEIGWSTSIASSGVPVSLQSKLLGDAICDAKRMGYSGVYVYNLKDSKSGSNNTEDGFGIYYDNLMPKISASIIANIHCR